MQIEEEIACTRCSSTKIKKNGKTANRKQRYQCKDCGRQFITAYSYLGRIESVRELIVTIETWRSMNSGHLSARRGDTAGPGTASIGSVGELNDRLY
jgi:DNA-directed RNA polymerase subunit RPC12/RpoP